ncbi:ATP-binding protein, partial [Burkholderia pseudomallei]
DNDALRDHIAPRPARGVSTVPPLPA